MATATKPVRSHAETALPPVVDQAEWQAARDELLVREKAHTRAGDELAAARRALPMVRIEGDWQLTGADGPVTLLDLFEGRRQLVLYHHMLKPQDDAPCAGCSMWSDGLGRLEHVNSRDVTVAIVAEAPFDELDAYCRRLEITAPHYSSHGSTFNADVNPSPWGPGSFALSVFLRDGDEVFRTYATQGRGAAELVFGGAMLDVTPFGRQESFEQSPDGWPQQPTYSWGALHDEYSAEQLAGVTAPASAGESGEQAGDPRVDG